MTPRRRIQIGFRYFWPGFSLDAFERMFPFLRHKYDFVESDSPEVLFFSCFTPSGKGCHDLTDAAPRTVFLTGENVRPLMDRCDFAISFRRDVTSDRHLRLPNYVTDLYLAGLSLEHLLHKPPMTVKSRFCAFVQGNGGFEPRNRFVRLLSRYKRVDCPGACLNNMPRLPPRTEDRASRTALYDFLAKYRFVVAFENCDPDQESGYVTEKIVNAMVAGAIPIYYGDPRVGEDFNPASFVHVREFENVGQVIDRIRYLDETPAAYSRVYNAPWLPCGRIPLRLREHFLAQFFDRVFAQPNEASSVTAGAEAKRNDNQRRCERSPHV